MLLFIDYRKAFDTVDSSILLLKLEFGYNFSKSAIDLIANYFKHRKQVVKFGFNLSETEDIDLGIPQGGKVSPFFFKVMINDLPFLLYLLSLMFADDTTIYKATENKDESVKSLIRSFILELNPLLDWCFFNRLDINWKKTEIMFISSRRVIYPKTIMIDNKSVDVVDSFRLLGVVIDNKLNFSQHVSTVCKQINTRLFSIKKLFYLPTTVKIQFFKTFILPCFDYCLSLVIYFPKYTIQKLANSYYMCLFKLFNFNFNNKDCTYINNFLKRYKLFSFEHRILLRISMFIFKIIRSPFGPLLLKNQIIKKDTF